MTTPSLEYMKVRHPAFFKRYAMDEQTWDTLIGEYANSYRNIEEIISKAIGSLSARFESSMVPNAPTLRKFLYQQRVVRRASMGVSSAHDRTQPDPESAWRWMRAITVHETEQERLDAALSRAARGYCWIAHSMIVAGTWQADDVALLLPSLSKAFGVGRLTMDGLRLEAFRLSAENTTQTIGAMALFEAAREKYLKAVAA